MKFSTKKAALVVAISVPCVFSMMGCMQNDIKFTDRSDSAVNSSVSSQDIDSSSTVDTTFTEISSAEETVFDDLVDETIPANSVNFTNSEIDDILYYSYNTGAYYIGRGNPKLESFMRNFTSNPELNVEDVTSFEFVPREADVYDALNYDNSIFDLDFVRYICSENNLRLFVDEIPFEYFSDRFPEYVKMCSENRYNEIGASYHNSFPDEVGYKTSLIDMNYNDLSKRDVQTISCFRHLGEFNYYRECVAANFPKDYGGAIANGKSVDGKYVWCLTEKQYNKVMEYIHKLPKCENVNILVPETREDLIASGIDVEKYDEMCEQLFGGAKMEKNKIQDDQSRSRG